MLSTIHTTANATKKRKNSGQNFLLNIIAVAYVITVVTVIVYVITVMVCVIPVIAVVVVLNVCCWVRFYLLS